MQHAITPTIDDRRKRRGLIGLWRRLVARLGLAGALGLVVVLIGATAAVAVILARAEVTGGVTPGTVSLDWAQGSTTYASAVYAADGETIIDSAPLASGITASATVTNGVLNLDVGNVFPGDGIIMSNLFLANNSTLDVDLLSWTYNGSYGGDGSGAEVELFLAEWNGSQFVEVPVSSLGPIPAGGSVGPYTLIVEFPSTSIADGTLIDATGVSVDGEAVR